MDHSQNGLEYVPVKIITNMILPSIISDSLKYMNNVSSMITFDITECPGVKTLFYQFSTNLHDSTWETQCKLQWFKLFYCCCCRCHCSYCSYYYSTHSVSYRVHHIMYHIVSWARYIVSALLAPCHVAKFLLLIWRSDTYRFIVAYSSTLLQKHDQKLLSLSLVLSSKICYSRQLSLYFLLCFSLLTFFCLFIVVMWLFLSVGN